ncbi:aspartyl-phosphate phosphatase Spo0E family protein [Desulfosporosinus sp. Sb-LF]|uniref:aspartyl-phosphate phosphatase Spo0E family protein n=1 Tax=Desulfosporosinus sp. Sb-LF TaxID=2560027 RepID=UPI00107F69A9|nr:aspartyl-phosphate phosphatase Spo0E family protein [Desulfosporosinus sp. Sb-LF]TGE34596.1 aspartyl-phosphate phosphatase Spo0E family protein [Desulfosporosinus sp. Sb-LF]
MCRNVKDANIELKTLLKVIEDLREELNLTIGQGKNPLDPFVLKLSQDLDTELNRFYYITLNKASSY